MIRGLYIATSGMTANERLQEINANNIANANTVGYKAEDGVVRSFPELLQYRLKDDQGGVRAGNHVAIGRLGYGALMEEIVPRFVQGALKDSDNPYARAIVDTPKDPNNQNEVNRRSYFPVAVGGEIMYTRDGDFKVQTGTHYLVTSKGDPVLPVDTVSGNVMANLRIRVERDGTFQYIDLATGQPFAPAFGGQAPTLGVVDIVNSHELRKYGETYFTGGQVARGTGQIVERQLEQSNVDLASAMVSMINVMRSYEANQRMIRTLDGTLEKAVSIGRLG
jgi:flagellar basal-body rod protein FlgF